MRTLPTLHVVVLLATESMADWPEALEKVKEVASQERLIVVPADPTAHVTQLTHVYRRAQPYLTLAHAVGAGAGIVTVKELRLYAVLAGIPLSDRVEFVRDMLGPVLDLPEHKATELLDTLDAVYRRRGRIADAARALHLHQNSVRYRLNRIEQLTGLCLDVPAERLHLELAMRLRWVAKAELATLDDPPKARVRTRPA
jgi:DNA-binding PucR family transcriptional regulator